MFSLFYSVMFEDLNWNYGIYTSGNPCTNKWILLLPKGMHI